MAAIKEMLVPILVKDECRTSGETSGGKVTLLPPRYENPELLQEFEDRISPGPVGWIESIYAKPPVNDHERLFGVAGAAGPAVDAARQFATGAIARYRIGSLTGGAGCTEPPRGRPGPRRARALGSDNAERRAGSVASDSRRGTRGAGQRGATPRELVLTAGGRARHDAARATTAGRTG